MRRYKKIINVLMPAVLLLDQAEGKFSGALLLYAEQLVKPEYRRNFERFADYFGGLLKHRGGSRAGLSENG